MAVEAISFQLFHVTTQVNDGAQQRYDFTSTFGAKTTKWEWNQ